MALVRVSRAAQRDLRSVLRHLAENGGREPAIDFAEAFENLQGILARHPLAYSERTELGPEVRGAVIGSYLAIYRFWSGRDEAVILRVLHGSRDIGPGFRRMT